MEISSGVTTIGDAAFHSCAALTNITIPGSVTNIGDSAFAYCTNLTGIFFTGNVPSVIGSTIFNNSPTATVYYLPGTTGWGPTFGGRPTALWNPQSHKLGVQADRFSFNITGTTNIPIVVEAATNLNNAPWTLLLACTLTNGSVFFSDAQWTDNPARFYRVRWP